MESIDLNLLVALDALLQEGSVTLAARRVGLSTPAMSHALARLRLQVGDPLLVRSGRGMLLTPRAEALRASVHSLVAAARQALTADGPFVARELDRTFVIHASDYVLTMLGLALDRVLRAEAPRVKLRFVPNSPADATALRDGGAELAIGIYGDLPQEMRSRPLLTDRFVCLVRADHPAVGKRLTLDQYVGLSHVQVAPRGRPGGYIDELLRARGLGRVVARAVPYFVTAMQLVAQTDYVLTISERLANKLAPGLGLRVVELPLDARPYALSLVWHPRFDGDPGHRFVRDALVRVAREVAGDTHPEARTRLEAGDLTAGPGRRRRRAAPRRSLHATKR